MKKKPELKKLLNKGVSTPVGIIIILTVAVVVGAGTWYFGKSQAPEPSLSPSPSPSPSSPVSEEPYIKVISPNGGEELIMGETYNITWDCGLGEQSNFDIYVVDRSGNRTVIGSVVSCPLEKYTWKVGNDWNNEKKLLSGKYKVEFRVVAGDSTLHDASDDYFSIVQKDEYSLLNQLEKETKIQFSDIEPVNFSWNILAGNSEEVKDISIDGQGFFSTNITNEEIQEIRLFFENDGFDLDVYNIADATGVGSLYGYKKGKTVCLFNTKIIGSWDEITDETSSINAEISCGQIQNN